MPPLAETVKVATAVQVPGPVPVLHEPPVTCKLGEIAEYPCVIVLVTVQLTVLVWWVGVVLSVAVWL